MSAQETAALALLHALGPLPCSGCAGSGETLGHRCRACQGYGYVCRVCSKPTIGALCGECRR